MDAKIKRVAKVLGTLHCEKSACLYSECPVWILERIIASEPLGKCCVCDESVVLSLEKAIEKYHDPNINIYCCTDCRTAVEDGGEECERCGDPCEPYNTDSGKLCEECLDKVYPEDIFGRRDYADYEIEAAQGWMDGQRGFVPLNSGDK